MIDSFSFSSGFEALIRIALLLCGIALACRGLRRVSAWLRADLWFLSICGSGAVLLLCLGGARLVVPVFPEASKVASSEEIANTQMVPTLPEDGLLEQSGFGLDLAPSFAVTDTVFSSQEHEDTANSTAGINWFLALWLVPTGVLLSRVAMGMIQLRGLGRARGDLVSSKRIVKRIDLLRGRFGIRRRVELKWLDHGCGGPMTWGILRPVIALPVTSADWSDEQLDAALAHELGHIQRRDFERRLVVKAITAFLWFHPLVWVASRRMAMESELACDDYVLRLGMIPEDFAKLLVLAAKESRSVSMGISMAKPNGLERRVVALLDSDRPHQKARRRASFGLFVGMLVPVAVLAIVTPVAKATEVKPKQLEKLIEGEFKDAKDSTGSSPKATWLHLRIQGFHLSASEAADLVRTEPVISRVSLYLGQNGRLAGLSSKEFLKRLWTKTRKGSPILELGFSHEDPIVAEEVLGLVQRALRETIIAQRGETLTTIADRKAHQKVLLAQEKAAVKVALQAIRKGPDLVKPGLHGRKQTVTGTLRLLDNSATDIGAILCSRNESLAKRADYIVLLERCKKISSRYENKIDRGLGRNHPEIESILREATALRIEIRDSLVAEKAEKEAELQEILDADPEMAARFNKAMSAFKKISEERSAFSRELRSIEGALVAAPLEPLMAVGTEPETPEEAANEQAYLKAYLIMQSAMNLQGASNQDGTKRVNLQQSLAMFETLRAKHPKWEKVAVGQRIRNIRSTLNGG